MKNKKNILILSIGFIFLISGITYAWWQWASNNDQNTSVSVTIGGVNIKYEAGTDITSNNLLPTTNRETEGKSIKKDITVSTTSQAYLNLYLDINSIDSGLKHESFRYELMKGNESITTGNFANVNNGDTLTILENVSVSTTDTVYTLYIWIDGSMNNPNTMYNQGFKFSLRAEATDISLASNVTLRKLQTVSGDTSGFTSNGEKTSFDSVATTNEGIFEAPDDYGTSYYWRGNTTNNYLKFGKDATSGQDLWWRIIRINGDGSIRIIYNGTSSAQTGTTTQISATAYNADNYQVSSKKVYQNNAGIGYTFGTPGGGSYDAEHHGTTPSTIKGVVDTWYENNIKGKYDDKISNTLFCADRTIDNSVDSRYTGDGIGSSLTGYAPWARLYQNGWKGTQPIQLTCTNKADTYTTAEDTEKGNGYLKYPLGLITSDEVVAGGGLGGTANDSYYLYTNQRYWTMSPCYFDGSEAGAFAVITNGYLGSANVHNAPSGVRPVLNLRSDVTLSGKGTSGEPFIVEGAV